MILLIRMSALCFSCIVHNLNSIMILLIQLSHLHNWFRVLQFKFHYDSINSSEGIKEYTCKTWFKFHYDSINSAVWIDCNEIISIYLNSIMILLIRQSLQRCSNTIKHLNSIMILLILLSVRCQSDSEKI